MHAAGGWSEAVRVLQRALAEVHIAGVSSNVGFLQALAATQEFEANLVTTTFIEENMVRLCDPLAPGVQREKAVPVVIESNKLLPSHHDHGQLPAGSIPLTSPIRGRVTRLAVQVLGQISSGACVCVIPLGLCTKQTRILCSFYLFQVRARKHEDGDGAVCATRLCREAVVCGCRRCSG